MRPNHQNKRMRGRNRNGKGPNPLSRTYESNGPDVKVRGTAQHIAEKYLQLGRDAQATGDHIAAENYFQHAEHYLRLIAAAQEQFRLQNPHYQPYSPNDQDEDGDEDGVAFGHGAPQPDVRFNAPQPDMEGDEQPRMSYPPREPREPREFQPRQQGEGQPHREGGQPREGRYQRDDRFPRRDRERGDFRNRGERNDQQPRFERQPAEAADDNVLPAFITAPVRAVPTPSVAEEPVAAVVDGAPEAGEFPRRRRGRPPRRPAEGEGE